MQLNKINVIKAVKIKAERKNFFKAFRARETYFFYIFVDVAVIYLHISIRKLIDNANRQITIRIS